MDINPGDNWRWYFDKQYDRLMLDLANGIVFRSRFSAKMLISDAFVDGVFDIEDMQIYHQLVAGCQRIGFKGNQRAELVLNALAALRFLKPLMPKSWHFIMQNRGLTPLLGEYVEVQSLSNERDYARLLVIEVGEQASLCVLAQSRLVLAGKIMRMGDAIKVMHDRLLPLSRYRHDEAVFAYAV